MKTTYKPELEVPQDYQLPAFFKSDLDDLLEAMDAYNQDRWERGLVPLSFSEIMDAKDFLP